MNEAINANALRALLKITERCIDGGEVYLFFDDELTKDEIKAAVELHVSLRGFLADLDQTKLSGQLVLQSRTSVCVS
jgi:hypothetical protein